VLLANQMNSVPAGKCIRHSSSRVTDVAINGLVSATADDDSDICEVDWDSHKPLSGNFSHFC